MANDWRRLVPLIGNSSKEEGVEGRQWVQTLTVDIGMDSFIFAAPDDNFAQTQRFAYEVAPGYETRLHAAALT